MLEYVKSLCQSDLSVAYILASLIAVYVIGQAIVIVYRELR